MQPLKDVLCQFGLVVAITDKCQAKITCTCVDLHRFSLYGFRFLNLFKVI